MLSYKMAGGRKSLVRKVFFFILIITTICSMIHFLTLLIYPMPFKRLVHSPFLSGQRTYRAIPDIPISKGENMSLQVLLKRHVVEPASEQVTKDTKLILWYTPTRYHPVLSKLHPLRGCPEAPCRVTTNRYFYNQSEVLIFTAQILDSAPPPKLPNQVWILHNHESPRWVQKGSTYLYTKPWRSVFNWTLDYRFDADIHAPYATFRMKDGVYQKRPIPPGRDYRTILSSKNGTIAWMVSNCYTISKRMQYVKELQKYVNVDIYGGCGKKHCPRFNDNACLEHLSKQYRFYLAFENALCKDYITEKFFHYFNLDMVLIVRGGGNYTSVSPPGTYINTDDFPSARHLADYIKMIMADDEKYLDILRKKDKYDPPVFEEWPIVKNGEMTYMTYHYDALPMCEVCNRLWNTDKYEKHYKDITKWFDKGLCYHPHDLN